MKNIVNKIYRYLFRRKLFNNIIELEHRKLYKIYLTEGMLNSIRRMRNKKYEF